MTAWYSKVYRKFGGMNQDQIAFIKGVLEEFPDRKNEIKSQFVRAKICTAEEFEEIARTGELKKSFAGRVFSFTVRGLVAGSAALTVIGYIYNSFIAEKNDTSGSTAALNTTLPDEWTVAVGSVAFILGGLSDYGGDVIKNKIGKDYFKDILNSLPTDVADETAKNRIPLSQTPADLGLDEESGLLQSSETSTNSIPSSSTLNTHSTEMSEGIPYRRATKGTTVVTLHQIKEILTQFFHTYKENSTRIEGKIDKLPLEMFNEEARRKSRTLGHKSPND